MIDGVPFLYQTIDGFVFHVSEKVKTIKAWDSSKSIVAFVDGDGAEVIPKRFLHYRYVRFILASSPRVSTPSWMNQIGIMDSEIVDSKRVIRHWSIPPFFVSRSYISAPILGDALVLLFPGKCWIS